MKVAWVGGPLDGAEDRTENMPPLQTLWYGPDLSEPLTKVIVYGLYRTEVRHEYRFSQDLTNEANRQLEIQRGVASKVTGTEDGGSEDVARDDREDAGEDRQGRGATGQRDSGGAPEAPRDDRPGR